MIVCVVVVVWVPSLATRSLLMVVIVGEISLTRSSLVVVVLVVRHADRETRQMPASSRATLPLSVVAADQWHVNRTDERVQLLQTYHIEKVCVADYQYWLPTSMGAFGRQEEG